MAHFLDGTDRDSPALAGSLMLGALAILAVQDSLVRLAGFSLSFWQFQAIRASSNFVLLCLTGLILMRALPPWPRTPWAVVLRSLMMILATVFFFGAIPKVTTVEMAAGLYTYPIFVTILSATILGEPVGWRRVLAVLVGACGAALILQPFRAEFEPIKLMPIGAGLCYAVNVILTRRWCRGESALTLGAAVAVSFMVIGTVGCVILTIFPTSEEARETIPYLAFGWREITLTLLGVTLICSVLNATANVMLIKSYQSAEASWLAPIDYSYLIFASLCGLLFFGDLPDEWQVAGMILIASAGIFTAWRERLRAGA
ncbi:MAG: DMT family transporter [Pseudomonadota bacterium]